VEKPFAERGLIAMQAGKDAGDDKCGKQSTCLVLYCDQDHSWLNMRADDHGDRLTELRRLHSVAQPRRLHLAETMVPRENPQGMIDRRKIDDTIAMFEAERVAAGRPLTSYMLQKGWDGGIVYAAATPLDLAARMVHICANGSEAEMGILTSLLRAVTWWNGQTLNTQLWTWRKGRRVGEDAMGNVFYENADKSRRWVIFSGESEASQVSPDWHGWLHHTWDQPPTAAPLTHKSWEKPHLPNQTGTDNAYAPAGSLRRVTPKARSDYEAWTPE